MEWDIQEIATALKIEPEDVVSDIQRFPTVPYWVIPVEIVREWWQQKELGKTTKISRDKALELLRRM